MSNLNNPDELTEQAQEVTVQETQGTGGPDRPAPPGFVDPAARGSESAAEPPPQDATLCDPLTGGSTTNADCLFSTRRTMSASRCSVIGRGPTATRQDLREIYTTRWRICWIVAARQRQWPSQ